MYLHLHSNRKRGNISIPHIYNVTFGVINSGQSISFEEARRFSVCVCVCVCSCVCAYVCMCVCVSADGFSMKRLCQLLYSDCRIYIQYIYIILVSCPFSGLML